MEHPKRRSAGYEERRHLLESALGIAIPVRAAARRFAPPAKPDDLLDAVVAAWSAMRVARGLARRVPDEPHRDTRGLRMEIVS